MKHTLATLPFCLFALTAACSSDDATEAPAAPYVCDAGELAIDEQGLTFATACPGMAMRLLPQALIAGQWLGGTQPADCQFKPTEVRCPVENHGDVVASIAGNVAELRFEAAQDVSVEGLALVGTAELHGARGFMSNGFQSWSQSGALALGAPPTPEKLRKVLAAREDQEVVREGPELSWWYTYAGGDQRNLFAGVLSAKLFRSYVQVYRDAGNALTVRLVSGGAGESVPVLAGQSLDAERWQLGLSNDLDGLLTRYAAALPSRRATNPVAADAGWNSWYDLWDRVTEQDIRENAPLAREALEGRVPASALPLRIVIDDGWQQLWGEWEANEKFPSGMDGLATDLKAQGFRVGIWLAPLLVHESSQLVADHPSWFLANASYAHPTNGKMRILDPTEPEAAAHIQEFIQRIVGWGFDFLKIDFLFAGTYEEPRHENVTGMQAYREALRLIREAAGEDVVLLAVGAPSHPTFEYVDAWRLGGDIAFDPIDASWFFIPNQARSIAARWHLCSAVLCDADPPLLRKLPRNEVEVGVWTATLAGGALFLSDDLRTLPEERRAWLLDEAIPLAVSGTPMVPQDAFPAELPSYLTNSVVDQISRQSKHVLPSVWSSPSVRMGINFTDEDKTAEGTKVPARSAVKLDGN